MKELTPFAIAKLFTDLIGRNVNFTQVLKAPPASAKQVYGTYLLKPMDSTAVVQVDRTLLGSLAGAMLGFPGGSMQERLSGATLDESLRDAMHEILNITSTVVSLEYRAVFQKMYMEAVVLPSAATDVMHEPLFRSYFNVSVDSYDGGAFSIFSPALG
jgi:hypothetical protein